jgi:hypothetical protein
VASVDAAEAVAAELEAAGFRDVCYSVPNGAAEGLAVVMPSVTDTAVYFDGSRSCDIAIEVYSKRASEQQAMDEAGAVSSALADMMPESANGSYRPLSVDAGFMRPLAWDESGFYVWMASAVIHAERKD